MNRAENVLSLTRRGVLRRADLVDNLIYLASEMPVEELVPKVPLDVLGEQHRSLDTAPQTDDEWSGSLFIVGGSYRTTAEQASEVSRTNYRKGVEALRKFFTSCDSGA